MAPGETFDPVAFKDNIRSEWRSAAAGWKRWLHVVEAPAGGQRHSAKLVELAELRPGAIALDVGGGYGEPSLTAAQVVGPEGWIVCTDISEAMLDVARERFAGAGVSNVEFIAGDAEELDFDAGRFDAILSRATIMFLPDVAATLGRLRGFLRPDGRLAASVWGQVADVEFAAAFPVVAQELQLPPPPLGRPGAFALSDPERLGRLVTEAGFRDVETGSVSVVFETESAQAYTDFIRDVAPQLTTMLASQPEDVRTRVWSKVTDAYRRFAEPNGRVRTRNRSIWVRGTA